MTTKNVLLHAVSEEIKLHPIRLLIEFIITIAFTYLLFERIVRRATGQKKSKHQYNEMEHLPIQEQERRLAQFQSKPFRAQYPITSNVPVKGYNGMLQVEARDGAHITVNNKLVFDHPTQCLDLATYDFHSFSTNEAVVDVARQTVVTYGVGSCGPRGFYGTVKPHYVLQQELAKFLGTDDVIVYSFAYATISTLISCFASRSDYLVHDELINSAVTEGCTLSRAHLISFKHNDMSSLQKALEAVVAKEDVTKPNRRFVVTEGVFRNSGDICPLPAILDLCKMYKFRLILDDSYGFGALGKTGRGTPQHFDIPTSDVNIYVGSLSGALGAVGGFCAGESHLIDFQRLGASAYVFSAALPPYISACASKGVELLDKDHSYVERLQCNTKWMRQQLRNAKFNASKIALVEADGDASPIIILSVALTYIDSHSLQAVQRDLQGVVNEVQKGKVIILRIVFDKSELVQNRPGLRIVMKGKATSNELEHASMIIIDAVKSKFN